MADAAIQRLNNQPFKGRPLSVSEARARESGPGAPRPMGGGPPRMGMDWPPRPMGAGRRRWAPRSGEPSKGARGISAPTRRSAERPSPRDRVATKARRVPSPSRRAGGSTRWTTSEEAESRRRETFDDSRQQPAAAARTTQKGQLTRTRAAGRPARPPRYDRSKKPAGRPPSAPPRRRSARHCPTPRPGSRTAPFPTRTASIVELPVAAVERDQLGRACRARRCGRLRARGSGRRSGSSTAGAR